MISITFCVSVLYNKHWSPKGNTKCEKRRVHVFAQTSKVNSWSNEGINRFSRQQLSYFQEKRYHTTTSRETSKESGIKGRKRDKMEILSKIAENIRDGQVSKVKFLVQTALDNGANLDDILNKGLIE